MADHVTRVLSVGVCSNWHKDNSWRPMSFRSVALSRMQSRAHHEQTTRGAPLSNMCNAQNFCVRSVWSLPLRRSQCICAEKKGPLTICRAAAFACSPRGVPRQAMLAADVGVSTFAACVEIKNICFRAVEPYGGAVVSPLVIGTLPRRDSHSLSSGDLRQQSR